MSIYTWGSDRYGQLGLGRAQQLEDKTCLMNSPTRVSAMEAVVTQAAGGEGHSIFCTEFGDVYTVGRDKEGLENASTTRRRVNKVCGRKRGGRRGGEHSEIVRHVSKGRGQSGGGGHRTCDFPRDSTTLLKLTEKTDESVGQRRRWSAHVDGSLGVWQVMLRHWVLGRQLRCWRSKSCMSGAWSTRTSGEKNLAAASAPEGVGAIRRMPVPRVKTERPRPLQRQEP
eukprot:scaffold327_cov257-Pinguiococcus_pyrenoidosus.AAC.15